ncbi:CGNR zinc finger domain-containing protein [Streptomyces sp. N50]|uniref:CGNR zinc finger domain-containing protein n=1 Tax=Streptomyces sp. N50 TaxID=3081765 RepID=UPI0029623450|nr:CGNR zinc finger domain-containing protein [Streptomyces sp. N50]WOX10679.1 CGNR zinc finger domain-containing protein [Streptomyces sp. N50]
MSDGDGVVDLVLVEQFLNTLDERSFSWHGERHTGNDELTSVQGLLAWLEAHGLAGSGQEPGPSDLAAARALRAGLRDALTSGTDDADSSDNSDGADRAKTARALAPFPLVLAPDADGGGLRLVADSGTPGLDTIVETVAASVAGGRWSRLKLCASPDCRWAFYDTSRNGGGRWCSMDACGNRNKTRAYRRRHAD